MTVIHPNSISGITSVTSHSNALNFYESDHSTKLTINAHVNGNVTGDITATNGTFSGDVTVGGTLTYEDVTNIDAVGVVTARAGVNISGGNLQVGGTNVINSGRVLYNLEQLKLADTKELVLGSGNDLKIQHSGSHSFISQEGAGALKIKGDDIRFEDAGGTEALRITSAGDMGLGTGTPTSFGPTFQVAGTDPALLLQDTATAVDYFGVNVTSGITQLWYDDAAALTINTASGISGSGLSEKLRITSAGQVIVNGTQNLAHPNMDDIIVGDASGNRGITVVSGDAAFGTLAFGDSTDGSGNDRYQGFVEYYHSENSLRLGTVAQERLRIDSSGRMGLGANNPGDYDGEANDFVVRSANHTGITIASSGSNQRCNLYFSDGTTSTQKYRGAITYDHNDDSLMVRTAAVERLRISSNGSATFDKGAPGGANQVIARFQAESSRRLDIVWHDSGSRMGFDTPGSHPYTFKIGGSEYLRLRSTHGAGNAFGPLLESVNGTGAFFDGGGSNKESDATVAITKQSNNDWGLMVRNYEGSSTDYGFYTRTKNTASYAIGVYDHDNSSWRFRVNGVGSIHATNTTVQSISDQRLKENIVDANSQWDDIKALRFRNFRWREDSGYSDGKTYLGLIAQEVEPISPNLIEINAQSKEDIENEVPDPEYKNVKYSIVWMKAVKALQEAQTRIETLETQLTDALARITVLEG